MQILGELDRDAWGVVARGKFRGQLVAMKSPHPAILNEHTIQRLQRGVRTMAQLHHPNLLHFIAAAVFDDRLPHLPPLIVMELLDTNLRAAYQNGRLSDVTKMPIFQDVTFALRYLHEHLEPIIHRNVSAPNVLFWKSSPIRCGEQSSPTLGQPIWPRWRRPWEKALSSTQHRRPSHKPTTSTPPCHLRPPR